MLRHNLKKKKHPKHKPTGLRWNIPGKPVWSPEWGRQWSHQPTLHLTKERGPHISNVPRLLDFSKMTCHCVLELACSDDSNMEPSSNLKV